jgi:hypothetical protein
MGMPLDDTDPSSSEPIVEHIYLGNRIIASVTGSGQACFIATVAYGTPLAKDLDVYRAFRDGFLKRFDFGRGVIKWYYREGPKGADWIKAHDGWRLGTRIALSVFVVPLKVAMFGHFAVLFIIFVISLLSLITARKLGLKWSRAFLSSFIIASFIISWCPRRRPPTQSWELITTPAII